ncbi:MAG TPA: hypothetical protein VIL30_10195 [Ramlibacter sp.]|jgi:hypothetical protein
MKPEIGRPESLPPGVRRAVYAVFCWTNRNPRFWRLLGWVLRRWPVLSHLVPFAARRSAVQQVLTRPRSFSSTSHTPNLIAGDYLIGMDPGPRYDADRQLFDAVLSQVRPTLRQAADVEAAARIAGLAGVARHDSFDLIEDYLAWVVYAGIQPAFADAAGDIVGGARNARPDEETTRNYLREIKYVAGHLFAGRLAPLEVRQRAEVGAASLKARAHKGLGRLAAAWPGASGIGRNALLRNTVGLAWVSHPVTAQSGALAFQELLGRPGVYAELRDQAGQLGASVWTDAGFRREVRLHVLELMRFRPIFPLLARDVPRATEFESGARTNPKCPAGGSLTVLSIAASFDTHRMADADRFCPHRRWGSEADMQYMMFGYGDRRCPAREEAVDMITSAFVGLLTLPELTWADRWGARIRYDGPLISRMRLRTLRRA